LKKLILMLSSILVFGMFLKTPIHAAGITVNLDGSEIQFDQPPITQNNRTLVPLRAIFEALGAKVDWDNDTKNITATKDNMVINLKIGSRATKVNGKTVNLDQAAIEMNGRTLVPLRFIGESLGATVNWDESTQHVDLTSPKEFKIIGIE
jgi:hypothetical protein